MRDFRDVKVWAKAHQLTLDVYRVTRRFPADERFGLSSQMRRASSSIGANIAEGCGRRGDVELGRYLQIAYGSASELENHALLARDLEFLGVSDYTRINRRIVEVKRMLAAFLRRVAPARATTRHRSSEARRMPASHSVPADR